MSSSAPAKFYYMKESPPCRTIMLVAKMLGIELDYQRVDLSLKEQLAPDFVAVNPFHVVPTLKDVDGYVIWESRVIAAYLIQTKRPESSLYPSDDLKKRCTIDKFLHYDLGTFYRALSDVVYPIFQVGKPALDKLPRLETVLETLEQWLAVANKTAGKTPAFITGDTEITLADISLYFSFTLTDLVPEIDLVKYANISAWLALVDKTIAEWNDNNWMDEAKENMRTFAEMLKTNALKEQAEQ